MVTTAADAFVRRLQPCWWVTYSACALLGSAALVEWRQAHMARSLAAAACSDLLLAVLIGFGCSFERRGRCRRHGVRSSSSLDGEIAPPTLARDSEMGLPLTMLDVTGGCSSSRPKRADATARPAASRPRRLRLRMVSGLRCGIAVSVAGFLAITHADSYKSGRVPSPATSRRRVWYSTARDHEPLGGSLDGRPNARRLAIPVTNDACIGGVETARASPPARLAAPASQE